MTRSEGGDVTTASPVSASVTAKASAGDLVATSGPTFYAAAPSAGPVHSQMTSSAAAPTDGNGVLLLGKLMRRDRRLFTWKWRDFVLDRTGLQYFSEKGNRKGNIPLSPHTPITIRMCNEPKPFGFLLFVKDTKLTLAAATERERRQWIDVFCDVFHASVEQTQADTKAERRARPTYLSIPDVGHDHESSSSNLQPQPTTSVSSTDTGDYMTRGDVSTPMMAHHALANEATKRDSFDEEVIPILESRMTYGSLKEVYSRITFPPSLANGDLLVGVGPLVRRMGWTDERILAVGLYIDPETATKELEKFHTRPAKNLYGDQEFYDHLLFHTTFRRSFVVTARKRVSKSVLTALLRDELTTRMGPNAVATSTFLSFIEKSLKKAESMVLRIHENGQFEFRLRAQLYPPIESHALCKCIQAIFFDNTSIQHDAKRGLIERLPSLWGCELLDAQDEIFGSVRERMQSTESEDDDSESDENGEDDDSEVEDLFGSPEHEQHNHEVQSDVNDGREKNKEDNRDVGDGEQLADKSIEYDQARTNGIVDPLKAKLRPSTKDEWADYDDEKLEILRRQSRSLMVHFGPIVDRDSNVMFSGDLVVDGSALLGTWSHRFSLSSSDSHSYRFSVGLYADPGALSESLLKYKGLSIGSIVHDPDYFRQFLKGGFQKHLVFKVDTTMKVRMFLEFLDARFASLACSFEDATKPLASLVELWDLALVQEHQQQLEVCLRDEVRFSIAADGSVMLTVLKGVPFKDDAVQNHVGTLESSHRDETVASTVAALPTVSSGGSSRDKVEVQLALPGPPFYLVLESLFFGFHAIDPSARSQLMERVPHLLDLAPDDLVHTYHDEIQALRENYKRQKPENRVKVGYLSISFGKRKVQKNAEKRGAKEVTVVPSRWSKRWCRLDGTSFSYYSHKRSRKHRDVMELTLCEVVEITTNSGPDVARFAWEKGETDSIRIAIIKPNGEILALRSETIYEGEEWLESLTDASNVRHQTGGPDNVTGKSSHSQRRCSSPRDLVLNRHSGSSKSVSGGVLRGRRSSLEQHAIRGTNKGARDSTRGQRSSVGSHTTQEVEEEGLDAAAGDESESDHEVVDKDGSLLAWVQEDPRHAIIVFTLLVIVYLASVMHRTQPVLAYKAALP
ncbi:hypothetical protein PsorP6_001901 [Peronosclerospora sorghi]|uniref:Uncharacterized protein n=1 Tax=Peronosclerospora sorghi TaxID=230839 RepID=A0ACC0WT34_9STRA|nr:hypothetical protein PsorP6_001901 [Peronosclerospora sorghi]